MLENVEIMGKVADLETFFDSVNKNRYKLLAFEWSRGEIKTCLQHCFFALSIKIVFVVQNVHLKNIHKKKHGAHMEYMHDDPNHMVAIPSIQNQLQNVKRHKIDLYRTSHFNSSLAFAFANLPWILSCFCCCLFVFFSFCEL